MQPIHLKLPTAITETPRLLLKELDPEALAIVFSSFSDEEIKQFFGLNSDKELELEKYKHAQGLTMYRISFKHFLMIAKETGNVIGRIGYHWWHVPHSRAEIGYAINLDEHKAKGYMTEALKEVVAIGFSVMKLNRIEAFASPNNLPSIRLLEGVGFKPEGLLREHYCKDGVTEDSACYSLLKREYIVAMP